MSGRSSETTKADIMNYTEVVYALGVMYTKPPNLTRMEMFSNATNDNDDDGNFTNSSVMVYPERYDFENPFNHPVVKFMFIALYSLVFLVCCVGNSLVLYTIGRTKRMRTRTNFFLANLAVADLSVGVVCVLPKLSNYLTPAWILGEAMCKIYHFAESMTYTASVLLLTAIAVERYIAITYPLRSKCLVTQNRLIFAQIFIWLLSAAYNAPELSMFNVLTISAGNDTTAFCYLTNPYANMRDYYTVNFVLWYVVPLSIMVFMYSRVACTLWKSSKLTDGIRHDDSFVRRCSHTSRDRTGTRQDTILCYDPSVSAVQTKKVGRQLNGQSMGLNDSMRQSKNTDNNNSSLATLLCGAGEASRKDSEIIVLQNLNTSEMPEPRDCRESTAMVRGRQQIHHQDNSHYHQSHYYQHHHHPRSRRYLSCDFTSEGDPTSSDEYDMLASNGSVNRRVRCQYRVNSDRVLSSRRRVIKLLIVVLLTFAICVFPYHLKYVLLFWHIYPTPATRLDIISPLSYVMLYSNSALNPILYWVFSDAFRRSFKDNCRRSCLLRSRFRHSR